MKDSDKPVSGNFKLVNSINTVIGVLQVVGTGIALVVVSIMGIKYMMASPSEKADTKKMIISIFIGFVLLFGAVNLVAIVANFSDVVSAQQ